MTFQTVHLETLESFMSVKGAFLYTPSLADSGGKLPPAEQSRAGLAEGGGEGLLGREDTPGHPFLGWGICPTFSLWLWEGPLLLPGKLLELAPPGLWGKAPSLPQARKDIASPMATFKAEV